MDANSPDHSPRVNAGKKVSSNICISFGRSSFLLYSLELATGPSQREIAICDDWDRSQTCRQYPFLPGKMARLAPYPCLAHRVITHSPPITGSRNAVVVEARDIRPHHLSWRRVRLWRLWLQLLRVPPNCSGTRSARSSPVLTRCRIFSATSSGL